MPDSRKLSRNPQRLSSAAKRAARQAFFAAHVHAAPIRLAPTARPDGRSGLARDSSIAGTSQALMSDAAQNAAKTLQAATESLAAGLEALETARAALLASGVKALQLQADSVAAFAAAASLQEALEVQQKLVRQSLELQGATVRSLGPLFSFWGAAMKPLTQR
jgi:hypothetical protein